MSSISKANYDKNIVYATHLLEMIKANKQIDPVLDAENAHMEAIFKVVKDQQEQILELRQLVERYDKMFDDVAKDIIAIEDNADDLEFTLNDLSEDVNTLVDLDEEIQARNLSLDKDLDNYDWDDYSAEYEESLEDGNTYDFMDELRKAGAKTTSELLNDELEYLLNLYISVEDDSVCVLEENFTEFLQKFVALHDKFANLK